MQRCSAKEMDGAKKRFPDEHKSIVSTNLLEGDIVDYMQETLESLELDPQHITMELTETYLVKADADVLGTMERMRRMGIRIAMDDFGVDIRLCIRLRIFQ